MSDQMNVARRAFLVGATSTILCVPAIVRATSLMPVRGLIMPVNASEPVGAVTQPQEGFVRRLFFSWCDSNLKSGRRESSFLINNKRLSESEMREVVAYARRHGFLAPAPEALSGVAAAGQAESPLIDTQKKPALGER